MSTGTDRCTLVKGHLDLMVGFSRVGAQRASGLADAGARISGALDGFNDRVGADYRVHGDGEPLLALGFACGDIDSYVGDIAERLRKADTLTVSFDMAFAAIAPRMRTATDLGRTASDLATGVLDSSFDALDNIRGGGVDGIVSVGDLQWAAEHATDPRTAAAAVWLLAHRAVVDAIDLADAKTQVADQRISKGDVDAYKERQAAYRVMIDNFAAFDGAREGKLDGKVSRADLLRMTYPPHPEELRTAARALADDPRGLKMFTSYGDQVAGVYDLDQVAKTYGEARVPLPAKPRNPITGAVCNVASFYSLIGWVDLVGSAYNADGEGVYRATPSTVGTAATRAVYTHAVTVINAEIPGATAAGAAKLVKLKVMSTAVAKIAGPGLGVTAAATVIDGLCRATDPKRRTWGSVVPIPQVAPPTATIPAPSPGTTVAPTAPPTTRPITPPITPPTTPSTTPPTTAAVTPATSVPSRTPPVTTTSSSTPSTNAASVSTSTSTSTPIAVRSADSDGAPPETSTTVSPSGGRSW